MLFCHMHMTSHDYGVTWRRCDMKKASHEEGITWRMASHEEWHCMKNGIAWRMASHEEGVTPLQFRPCLTRSIRVCDAIAINLTTSLSEWQWRKQSPKNILKNQQHVPKCSKLACLSDRDTIFWAKVGPTWVACMVQILGKTVNVG
jgi:hypothetical protein